MKKKRARVLLFAVLAALFTVQASACSMDSLKTTCKVEGCDETELYQDGYCKVHYYKNVGTTIINDLLN